MSALDNVVNSFTVLLHDDVDNLEQQEYNAHAIDAINALRQRVAELESEQASDYWKGQYDQLASAVSELHEFEPLEAAQAVVTPNNCRYCHKAAASNFDHMLLSVVSD